MSELPSLKFLHDESALVEVKLTVFRRMTTEDLMDSLTPGKAASLKARPDGTMIDGHHRIKILKERGIEIDSLPREVVSKT